jgi:hypothetical protein
LCHVDGNTRNLWISAVQIQLWRGYRTTEAEEDVT